MNGEGPRSVASCPYRHVIRSTEEDEHARCRLLESFLGPNAAELCEVGRDACEACVDAFPPTRDDINYVIASLLHNVTGEILRSERVDVLDRVTAQQVHDWSERCMPLMFHDEDDATSGVGSLGECGWVDLGRALPSPTRRHGPKVANWAVGITTAPRRLPTLACCLDALIGSGWKAPTLFVDSSTDLPPRFAGLSRTTHDPKVGAWPNYYLALTELTLRSPEADAYMILQDDALLIHHPGLRNYLETMLWPCDGPGIVSLYCATDYAKADPGWHELPPPWFWGALAFLFSPDAARRFLVDPMVLSHRRRGPEGGLAGIDVLIGMFAQRNEIPIYYPSPSLVQHIGQVSTLWPTARAGGSRRASQFLGDLPVPVPDMAGSREPTIQHEDRRITGIRFIRKPRGIIGADEQHRSGWPYAFSSLQPLAHEGGVIFDDFIEQIFCYGPESYDHRRPWVGVFHHPPNMPPFMRSEHVPAVMFQTEAWKRSRPFLVGAIALSTYLADYLRVVLGVPAFPVKHPSEIPETRWEPDRYLANPRKHVIQVGWYLKNTQLMYQFPEPRDHRRMRLLSTDGHINDYDLKVARHWRSIGTRGRSDPSRVIEQCRVSADRYDQLLAENLVAIELLDASANNVVIECIARNTPILVNRHPAAMEYLTEGYPLYFSDPAEIPGMLTTDRILEAHDYLKCMDKRWLNGAVFRESVASALQSLLRS